MATTIGHVADTATAKALRRAAIGAGMLARINVFRTGLTVTLDHADDRRDSALNLVEIYSRAVRADEEHQLLDLIVRMPSRELDTPATDNLLRDRPATAAG